MIDAALPSAAQRRFFPPKAARRSRKPLPAQHRQSLSKRRACVRRSQASSAHELVAFIPAANYPRRQPAKLHQRFTRGPKIPIGRARPTSPQPPRGFLPGRLSNAGPTARAAVS